MSHRGHKTKIHSQKEWDCLEITNYKIQITNKKGKLHDSYRIDGSANFFCLFSVLSVFSVAKIKRRKKWH
jgi:hypothetical protein